MIRLQNFLRSEILFQATASIRTTRHLQCIKRAPREGLISACLISYHYVFLDSLTTDELLVLHSLHLLGHVAVPGDVFAYSSAGNSSDQPIWWLLYCEEDSEESENCKMVPPSFTCMVSSLSARIRKRIHHVRLPILL